MRKLHLDLDSLRVDSFTPASAPAHKGTVAAHESYTYGASACGNTCSGHLQCFCQATQTC